MTSLRTLVVRGDLRSQTGWSRATRALVNLMRPHFGCLLGIDLHYSTITSVLPPPFRVINERDIDLLTETHVPLILLNMCLPHEFRVVPTAHNIGCFFWETDKSPPGAGWIDLISLMDQIWVPSRWQRDIVVEWIRNVGCDKDVRVIPWPHEIPSGPVELDNYAPRITVHRILTSAELGRTNVMEAVSETRRRIPRLGTRVVAGAQRRYNEMVLAATARELDLDTPPAELVFAVQTDVPRKGLPVLISEWLRFRRTKPNVILLLKLSSIDITKDSATLHTWLSRMVHRLNAYIGAPEGGIFVCYDRLSDATLAACYKAATAFVTASFGEGFGGPLVESVIAGALPVISAHTAYAELLPENYPFSVDFHPVVGKLVGELPLYPPSGSWHVPAESAIAARLSEIFAATPEARALELSACREYLRAVLSAETVAPLVTNALLALEKRA